MQKPAKWRVQPNQFNSLSWYSLFCLDPLLVAPFDPVSPTPCHCSIHPIYPMLQVLGAICLNYLLKRGEIFKFRNLLIDRFLSWQTKGHHVPEKALAVKSRSESGLQPRCQSPVWRGICWLVWQLTAHGLTSGHQAPASHWSVSRHPGLWLVTPRVPGLDASVSRSLSMLQSWAAVTRPH